MKLYNIQPKNPEHSVFIGWDPALTTFVAEVIDHPEPGISEVDDPYQSSHLLCVGRDRPGQIPYLFELEELIKPYAEIPSDIWESLAQDACGNKPNQPSRRRNIEWYDLTPKHPATEVKIRYRSPSGHFEAKITYSPTDYLVIPCPQGSTPEDETTSIDRFADILSPYADIPEDIRDQVSPKEDQRLIQLLEYARQHGLESDPEHEVGDLQQLVNACWNALDESTREAIHLQLTKLWEL